MIDPKKLDEIARKLGIGKYAKPGAGINPNPSNTDISFSIDETDNAFVLDNLPYRGGLYRVEWQKEFINKGEFHTLEQFNSLLENTKIQLPDLQLYNSTILHLYRNKENESAQNMQKMLRSGLAGIYVITDSKICYNKNQKDKVIHGIHRTDKIEIDASIAGKNGSINSNCGFDETLEALLGKCNLQEVEESYYWLSGKKPYLCRSDNAIKQDSEHTAVFGTSDISGYFILFINGGLLQGPGLGVIMKTISPRSDKK